MAKKARRLRPTLLDKLETGESRNMYCRKDAIGNEASVETFFVNRLLADLGYADGSIKTKESIETLTVSLGRKKVQYKPDYVLYANKMPRCVVDAKATDESVDDWIGQCAGYCLTLNRRLSTNPVQFFVLSNGIDTQVYSWDSDTPLLSLNFEDFSWGNPKYEKLRAMLSPENVSGSIATPLIPVETPSFAFNRPTAERARQLFAACHRSIWKSEVCSPSFAFMEFVKVMFIKLWADRTLRENAVTKKYFASGEESIQLPKASVLFSDKWIENREAEGSTNPVDTILFERLREDIEQSIQLRKKKRLFDPGERIKLRPDTIKDVVQRLQHFDMFGIDEDLNGRLFETFLSATMRGRELGQFFTPRSVVKLMTYLAGLQVTRKHQDRVLDGCCGSGGFLIEALTVMRQSVRDNNSLSISEREDLIEKICNESIYGIDYGKDPPLARIARINMYLHGDGGSRIYYADGLDKKLNSAREKDPEIVQNVKELRDNLNEPTFFDVVLTNPPFSMTKSRKNDTEKEILEQYKLATIEGTTKVRSSLRSSVMFIERYTEMLKPGGKLITLIDESILVGLDYGFVRDYIRRNFLIRAIISLHGDAFKRSGARIKTSILLLEKKRKESEPQPPCFTYFSVCLGVDDLTPRASDTDIATARALSAKEAKEIISGYEAYMNGNPGPTVISPDLLTDTLDLRSCVPLFGRMAAHWKSKGIEVKNLEDCLAQSGEEFDPQEFPDELLTLIKVSYAGRCKIDVKKKGREIKYPKMYRVRSGQMIFSTIRAVNGAIGIVPPELDGAVVSASYTVFDCGSAEDTAYLWGVLCSHEVRADIQSAATGASRYYAYWPSKVGKVPIPWLDDKKRHEVGKHILATWELERELKQERSAAAAKIAELGVESSESIRRWEASKPPQ